MSHAEDTTQRSGDGECAVRELDSSVLAELVSREHGVPRTTLYKWKSKYSGMDVSQVKRLKDLEEENRKLKQKYADLALDNRILRDVIEKNSRARGPEGAGVRAYGRIGTQEDA